MVYFRYESWTTKNGDKWTNGILSTSKEIGLPESTEEHNADKTGFVEIKQENVLPYQSIQDEDYIDRVSDAMKHTDCLILIDVVGNDVWVVNNVNNGNPAQIEMNTIALDKNAFPNGCKDLAGMFAL